AGDARLLVDLDAAAVGPAGVGPGDGVVAGDGPGGGGEGADDGRLGAAAGEGGVRQALLGERRADNVAGDGEGLVDLPPPALGAQRGRRVGQGEVAALGEEQVEVEGARQLLEQFEADLVEAGAFGREVVGADDGGVAPGAAAADVALFEDGDVADAVGRREVVRRRQPVPAAPDPYD